MRRRHPTVVVGAVALTALLASCATAISGAALPAPGATPPAKTAMDDPCTLLTPEQVTGMGLTEPGEFTEGDPGSLVPPGCRWSPKDTFGDVNSLTLVLSTDIAVEEYYDSAPPTDEKELGGLRWESYDDPIAHENGCALVTRLGELSFVQVSSLDFGEDANACETVEAAAVQVAGALPGGDAPPPPVNPDAVPPTPLSDLEPCDLVPPDRLEALGYQVEGEKTGEGRSGKSTGTPPGCEWTSKDPDSRKLYLALFLDKAAEDVAYDEKEVEKFDTGGRAWGVFKEAVGTPMNAISCSLILPYGPKSSVKVTSGHSVDPARTCEAAKAAAEALTPMLPPS